MARSVFVVGAALLFAAPALSQTYTKNLTGTTSYLPEFLPDPDPTKDYPWGVSRANDTDYYWDWPNTGVTRYYNWNVTKGPCAPDGVSMTCYSINNQIPGPLVEANWGDWIEITVNNEIEDEGTSIHWHGFLQKNTQYMDGVPGLSQCPIAPGKSFTYRFQAQLYGTGWYHSHYDAQSVNGAFGPLVVYGPSNAEYDEDLGPVVLSDWVHESYMTLVDELMAPFPDARIPPSQNNLINGMNPWVGTEAPIAKYQFVSGKAYRLRLMNAGCSATQKFTIDGHTFTVIANDFVAIEPYETDHITLGVGQRSDVVVQAWMAPGSAVWMRSYIAPCSERAGQTEAFAAIYYDNADIELLPQSMPGKNAYNEYCGNDDLALTVPYYAITPPAPDAKNIIPITGQSNGTHLLWYMAGRTMRSDYNIPNLLEAQKGNLDFPFIENVHNMGSNNSIIFEVQNTGSMPHPMHLHGHNMFVLANGPCHNNDTTYGPEYDFYAPEVPPNPDSFGSCWDGHVTNAQNPQRRDVQMILPGEYMVVQWIQDNPGVWPFHCHITWHGASGFLMSILERPEEVAGMQIPDSVWQTCTDWSAWTNGHVVDEIDDGL